MKKLIVAAALGTTLLAGSAYAQSEPPRRDPLARADANGDGVITRDEMLAEADARFAMLDTNKDGKLSGDEMQGMGGRMLQRADTDGDGIVTRDEFHAFTNKRFDRLDANHDGKIDATERANAMQMMRGGGPRRGDRMGPPPGDAPQNPPADQPAPDGN